jgi:hypothetical protein
MYTVTTCVHAAEVLFSPKLSQNPHALLGQMESGTSQSANSERNEEDEKQLKKLKDMDTLG